MCANINVSLMLNWYEFKGHNLLGEETIVNMPVDDVLELFDVPFWNNQYQCWAVDQEQIETLQVHVQHKINLQEHAYFVEMHAI